jgi:hypothetical protein
MALQYLSQRPVWDAKIEGEILVGEAELPLQA